MISKYDQYWGKSLFVEQFKNFSVQFLKYWLKMHFSKVSQNELPGLKQVSFVTLG